jgi:hypothetical protein
MAAVMAGQIIMAQGAALADILAPEILALGGQVAVDLIAD